MEFREQYYFLSNFFPCKIKLGKVVYNCAESAFQAVKLEDKKQRIQFSGLNGVQAKALGKRVPLRKDWNNIKIDVMRWIIHEKFAQNKQLAILLVNTENQELVETNHWNDTFWGVCNNVGKNWLGKILMEERQKLLNTK